MNNQPPLNQSHPPLATSRAATRAAARPTAPAGHEVHVHIERLVVDGGVSGEQVRAAVAIQLSRSSSSCSSLPDLIAAEVARAIRERVET
jgi:hypothetical protein